MIMLSYHIDEEGYNIAIWESDTKKLVMVKKSEKYEAYCYYSFNSWSPKDQTIGANIVFSKQSSLATSSKQLKTEENKIKALKLIFGDLSDDI